MTRSCRSLLREAVPPALIRLVQRLRGDAIRFTGDYSSWVQARASSSGYDDSTIIERVEASAGQARDGRAAFERDGVAFPSPSYPMGVVASLLHAALRNGGRLRVLDFGGSLGSTYYRCKPMLAPVKDLAWCIVEQDRLVAIGRERFQDATLRFADSIAQALTDGPPDIVLLSSVLPYLEEPYATLRELLGCRSPSIVIDRTPLLSGDRDRLTVQHVPASVYGKAVSYPAWFLSEQRLLAACSPAYRVAARWDGEDGVFHIGLQRAPSFGLLLERADL